VRKGCISAEEYEAVFILNDLAMLLRDLVRGETEEEPRYLEYLVSVICKARDEVFDKEVI
jgi:predicted NUDIX family phosphoesterase